MIPKTRSIAARYKAGLLLVALLPLTSACGPLISVGGDKDAPILYTLTPPVQDQAAHPELPVTLTVAEPIATGAINSRRIALMPSDLEVRYYKGVRWTDPAPRMIQNMLVSAFRGTVANVTADSMPVTPDYRLTARLVAFEVHYPRPKNPVASVAMELQLYSTAPLALVATRSIKSEEAATADKSSAISGAFNAAAQDAVNQAVGWAYDAMAGNQTAAAKE